MSEGAFQVVAPYELPADANTLSNVTSRLFPLTALRFVGHQPISSQGFDKATRLVIDHGGEVVELSLAAKTEGGHFARFNQGPVFVVDAGMALAVNAPLVDRALLSVSLDGVEKIAGEGRILLRTGEAFEWEEGAKLSDAERDSLSQLGDLTVMAYSGYSASLPTPPLLSIEVQRDKGKETLRFAKKGVGDAAIYYVVSSKQPLLGIVGEELVQSLSALFAPDQD